MTRIASKVAIETILYTVSGNLKVKVLDRESRWDENPKVVYEGEAGKLIGYKFARINRAEVYRTDIIDGVLVFTIETKFEKY